MLSALLAFSALLSGAGLVLQPVFDADQAVGWFGTEGITHVYGPANLLDSILDATSHPGQLASWRAALANFSGDGARVEQGDVDPGAWRLRRE